MSVNNLIGNVSDLKRLSFPDSVSEAVNRLGKICITAADRPPHASEVDRILSFIDDYIFASPTASSSSRNRRFPHLEQLQILRVLIDYFASFRSFDDSNQNLDHCSTVFTFLFMRPNRHDKLLHKLVSMSLGLRSEPVLECAGRWLDKENNSSRADTLTRNVLKDYVKQSDTLKQLPLLSQTFAAAIIISVGTSTEIPDSDLLSVILSWITQCPSLILAVSGNDIVILTISKWTILSPAISEKCDDKDFTVEMMHSAILDTLCEIRENSEPSKKREYLTIKQLCGLIQTIDSRLKELPPSSSYIQASLDRLGQVIQGVTSAGILQTGSTKELKTNLSKISRSNRLISIILKNI